MVLIILWVDRAVHLQDGSLEQFLAELGVPHDRVDATVQGAIVWRVTPAGRPLIDRRRRSRVERNVHSVTEHLVNECNLTKGANSTCRSTAWSIMVKKSSSSAVDHSLSLHAA